MRFLKNPNGKIVIVDDENLYNEYLRNGWHEPSQAEADDFLAERNRRYNETVLKEDSDVYYSTVQMGPDGYGVASQKLYAELHKIGVKISAEDRGQKIGLVFHAPYSVLSLSNPYKVLYTMFESTKIPEDWRDYLDACDKIIVPTKWCQSVFKASGFETDVIPLGYDDKVFKYVERPVKSDNHKIFYFLHYNAFNLRKGFLEVLRAFQEEFDPSEPVRMVFKTVLKDTPMQLPPSVYKNIEVIKGPCSDIELAELCARCDAFVFPSRGEGFGMTPLEAMATGLPTIVPNAHGITEYFNKDYMYEVKVEKETPATYSRYKDQDVGHMFLNDVKDLRKQMRYIYEHQSEAKEKGKQASEYVQQWTYKNTALKFKQLFKEIGDMTILDKPVKNVLTLDKIA